MTDEDRLAEDGVLDASSINEEPESVDAPGPGSHDGTPGGIPIFDVAKEVRAQILRTPPEQQIWMGMGGARISDAPLNDDESKWLVCGPLPGNVSGLILKTRSGACLHVLNPDVDLSSRWVWIQGPSGPES